MELNRDVGPLFVRPDDTLLVHSQRLLSENMPGGEAGMLAILQSAVSRGTLIMPSHTCHTVNRFNPTFDVLRTASCSGSLAEYFRNQAGVVRSWHPTHSVAIMGRDAAQLAQGDYLNRTPASRDSVYGRLLGRDARILILGGGLEELTFLSGVEEWVGITKRLSEMASYIVVTPNGERIPVCCQGYAQDVSRNFRRIHETLLARRAMRACEVEGVPALLLNARVTHAVAAQLVERDSSLFD